jgi:hypothetical protein
VFRGRLLTSIFVLASAGIGVAAQSTPPPTQTPVPKPFPTGTQPPTTKPLGPIIPTASAQQDGAAVDPRLTGIPIYPGAELLSSFDTGRGQYVFLLGSNMSYTDIVGFYKGHLRNSGSEVFRTPPMQQFDLGPFRSETMAYRPSVVVKDYSIDSQGYLHVAGTTEKRYRTVIQIVPVIK